MATVIGGNRVRLNDGSVINAQTGGWYDGRQFWNGSLSQPGQVHSESNQVGAGQMVSQEVNAQSAKAQGTTPQAFEQYLETQRQQVATTPPAQQSLPQPTPTPTPQISTPMPSSPEGAGIGVTAQAVPDLTALYDSMKKNSGVSDLELKLSEQEKAYINAVGQINDNPFLSEATRTGRIAKLDDLYQKRTANLKGDIETKKADIETKLNLQLQQFDLNSQYAQQSLERFNVLLSSGALDSASGEDIANLTKMTGLSSSAIYSAVKSNQAKNLTTTVQSYDDGTSQGYAILTLDQYGNIVNSKREIIGASKSTGEASNLFNTGSGDNLWEIVDQATGNISDGWNETGETTVDSSKGVNLGFSPAKGIGSTYTDPATGNKYQFTNSGWQPIASSGGGSW